MCVALCALHVCLSCTCLSASDQPQQDSGTISFLLNWPKVAPSQLESRFPSKYPQQAAGSIPETKVCLFSRYPPFLRVFRGHLKRSRKSIGGVRILTTHPHPPTVGTHQCAKVSSSQRLSSVLCTSSGLSCTLALSRYPTWSFYMSK